MRHMSLYLALLLCAQLQAAQLTDPTRPSGAPQPAAGTAQVSAPLRLEGILHSATRAVAIVDGRLVKAGEWIGNARIDAIGRDCVHYTRAGRKAVLRLAAPIKVRHSTAVREDQQ